MAHYRVRKLLKFLVALICAYALILIMFTYSNVIQSNVTLQDKIAETFSHKISVNTGRHSGNMVDFSSVPAWKCGDGDLVVAVVSSKATNIENRQAIRETWANATLSLGVRTVFVVGLPDEHLKVKIAEEVSIYGDMVVGSSEKSGRIATLKLLLGLTWAAENCQAAKFVFYGHDHIFVYFDKLFQYLTSLRGKDELIKSWHGRLSAASVPVRNPESAYYVSKKDFSRSVYPEFCTSEAGFILSFDAVTAVVSMSSYVPTITLDDIFLAVVAEKLSLRLFNNHGFSLQYTGENGCPATNLITSVTKANTRKAFHDAFEHSFDQSIGENCSDPKLEWVLPTKVSNAAYFSDVLEMLIQHVHACYYPTGKENDIYLVALVSSLPSHFDRRQAIRETWGSQKNVNGKKILLMFTLGLEAKTQSSLKTQSRVQVENVQHGDIIQGNFEESFQNLTLKVIMGLKWLTEYCPHAKYIYKGDDDMFVNLQKIVEYLEKYDQKENPRPLFTGNAMWTSVHIVDKKSKYHVSNSQYKGKYYPPYCSGGGYVFTGTIVPSMYRASRNTSLIPIDDAFHGILAKKIGIPITHNNGFKVFGSKDQKLNFDKCFLKTVMVVHKYDSPVALHDVWNKFTDTSVTCND